MLNSSLRHAARTCPNASVTTRCTTPSSSSIPIAAFSTRCHQRRYSSGKPPVPPNNGSQSIPTATVKQVAAPRSSDRRADTDSRLSKRKGTKGEKTESGKQVQDTKGSEWTLQFPSVPSTQHLNPKDVYVASFFSTHRPMCITGPLPPETQIKDFDKVFQVKPRRTRAGAMEVIYTLNSAVQTLDEQVQRGQQHGQQQQSSAEQQMVEQRADLIKALTQHNHAMNDGNQTTHLDGQPQRAPGGNVKLMIQEIARRFRPFNAPPAPVPTPDIDLLGREEDVQAAANEQMQSNALELEIERQDGTKMILQLHNTTPASDLKSGHFFTSQSVMSDSRSTVSITDPLKRPSKGGRLRRGMYINPGHRLNKLKYSVISVKRQRKLKMKKHKYKKLMRKTRNLRRRQDRL